MLTNAWFWVSVVFLIVIILLIFAMRKERDNAGDMNIVYGYDGEGWDPTKPLIYLATSKDVSQYKNGDVVYMVVRIKNTL